MGFKSDEYILDQINAKLLSLGLTLSMSKQKIKKESTLFNDVVRQVLSDNKDAGIQLYTIIISLSDQFEMDWLVDNVLDKKNKIQLEQELQLDFNVKKTKKK